MLCFFKQLTKLLETRALREILSMPKRKTKIMVYRQQKNSIQLNDCIESRNGMFWAQKKHVAAIYSVKFRVSMSYI